MDNKLLANALVKKGIISEDFAEKLILEAQGARKSLEDMVYLRRLSDEVTIAKIKSETLRIPYQKIKQDSIKDEVIKLIPLETATNYKFVPISKEGGLLVVGMVNPDEERAQGALKFIAKDRGLSLGVYIITPTDLELTLRKYISYKSEVEMAVRAMNIKPGKGGDSIYQRTVSIDESGAPIEEAPIIRIVSSTLKNAVADGASDIHIEPQRSRVRIRFRIDGELQEVSSLPLELEQPIISRVKILADLKIDENRIPQDGRFRTQLFGRDIDFRVSTFPTPVGEKAAIRVLDSAVGLKGAEKLGLQDSALELLKKAIDKPFGMILITGPTGSGKTTTLYSVIQILNDEKSNILSLEDPVEYFVDGANQSQVHPEIGYDFASGLRQILRQDPDVIMVGEIRDSETAKLAVHAALTGHIVLSTLHTNNALGVIPRLIDMGVDAFLLPSALNLMIAQRLVRRLCDNCKKAIDASPEISEIIKIELNKLSHDVKKELHFKEPYKVYVASGCKVCHMKGITGRIAIFEIFGMTKSLQDLIGSKQVSETKLSEEAKSQSMVTLRQDGIIKALRGLVFIEEVLRETEA